LVPFVQDSVEPGSVIHTDGWLGYLPLESKGYQHEVTVLKGKKKPPSELMPRVHLAISLLKRWLMGTHQGAVSHKHLAYYLDESRSGSIAGDQRIEARSSFAWRSMRKQPGAPLQSRTLDAATLYATAFEFTAIGAWLTEISGVG
jgi:hypothetical protein